MSKPKIKRVKAWALLTDSGEISTQFNHAHNVFQPRVFIAKSGALAVANVVLTGVGKLKPIPCTIVYSLPLKANRKK